MKRISVIVLTSILISMVFSTNVMANTIPVNKGLFPRNVAEDTVLPITTLKVDDPDTSATEELEQVKLSVNHGTIWVDPLSAGGATLLAGGLGTKSFTLKGDRSQLNAALATLKYQGALNFEGAEVLTIESTDKHPAKDRDEVSIMVTPVSPTAVVCDWSKSGSTVFAGDLWNNWSAGPTASYSLVQYNLADKKSSLNSKSLGAGISLRYYRSDHLAIFGEKFLGRPRKPSGPLTPGQQYAEDTGIADIPAGCRAQSTDLTGNGEKIASWYSISPTMYVFQEQDADDLGVQLALNFGFLNDIFSVGVGWNVSGDSAGEWFILAGPSYGFSF